MTHLAECQQTTSWALENHLACPSRLSSVNLPWSSLVVRYRVEPPNQEYLFLPGVPDPWMVIMLDGARQVEVRRGNSWRLGRSQRGSIAITSPSRPTEIRWRSDNGQPFETVHIHVGAGVFGQIAAEYGWSRDLEVIDGLVDKDSLIETLARSLVEELGHPGAASRLYGDSAAALLATRIIRVHSRIPAHKVAPAGLSPAKLRRVREFIDGNLTSSLALQDLADTAGVSLYHFARTFKAATGETPHAYVTRLRLERAKQLLRQTRHGLTHIALSVGFSSSSYFSKAFSLHVGLSPSQFRNIGR